MEHFLGWERGIRNRRATEENAQRLARLLYQVEPSLRDPTRLWRAEDVRKICKCFFEGNSSLPNPRKPGTLKAHIHSYRIFLQFVENPGVNISQHVAMEDDNRHAIRDTREKLYGWLKCLVPLSHKRKVEVQQEDLGEVLGEQEYELIREFSNLQADYMMNSTDFIRLQDLIILRLLLVSAQRPGAVANLTMNKFENGKWDQESNLYITGTVTHKTPSLGPAGLWWDRTTYQLAQVYLGR